MSIRINGVTESIESDPIGFFDNGLTSQGDLAAIEAGGLRVRTYGIPDNQLTAQGVSVKNDIVDHRNQSQALNSSNAISKADSKRQAKLPTTTAPLPNGVDSSELPTIAEYGQVAVEQGANALGKSKAAVKLHPAGALQKPLSKSIMLADGLENAQALVKSPNAKSAIAMAEFAAKNKVLLKSVPVLGDGLTVIEEGQRMLKAETGVQRARLGAVATFNFFGDKAVTGLGASSGAYLGAVAGAATGPFAPVAIPVFAVAGGVLGGSWFALRLWKSSR